MHTHYIQGIAFDPFDEIVASLSADRTIRFYSTTTKKKKAKAPYAHKHKVHAIQPAGYERQVHYPLQFGRISCI